ncbi:type II toxin-antitoxin system VapC family toxin [candidate division KSB1 bacterium]|nr:type II toxin-antitoxin system VapC family toxin [candidate division KSB1 bacterium]
MILLDTCALLWWTLAPHELSPKAAKACGKINEQGAFISSITIWEIGIKLKKGALQMDEDLNGYVNRLRLLRSIEIVPVDENIWIKNLALDWEHRDPADRTIVATAMIKNCPIVTKDQVIRDHYKRTIW